MVRVRVSIFKCLNFDADLIISVTVQFHFGLYPKHTDVSISLTISLSM